MSHGPQGEHFTPEPHLPHGSWWPVLLALAIAFVSLGLVVIGQSIEVPNVQAPDWGQLTAGAVVVMGLAVAFLLFVILGWVREDIKWWKTNTGTGPGMAKAGTLLFISSEVFIFGALFSSYFTFQRLADHWPDVEVHLPVLKTGIFTLFLFSSSATIHKAENHLRAGDHKGFRIWWWGTVALGAVFLAGQVNEYLTLVGEGLGLTAGQFMTSFYMITGTHGLHVFGGLVYLTIVGVRAEKKQFDEQRHVAPETAAMYWHFVDLVWVFVFSIFYLVPTYVL